MKNLTIFLTLLSFSLSTHAQSDTEQITQIINDFMNGSSYNDPDLLESIYHPKAQMYLSNAADTVLIFSPKQYADLFRKREKGVFNGRYGKILSIDVMIDVAIAKARIDIPKWKSRYYDILTLKKIEGKWKIIAKATSRESIPVLELNRLKQQVVVDKLARPWSMAFLNEHEVIIAEKDAGLTLLDITTKEKTKIDGLPSDIARAILIDNSKYKEGTFPSGADGLTRAYNAGLFQVLLDPNFEENKYLYLSYAAQNKALQSTTKVVRAKLISNTLKDIETLFVAEPYSHGLFHFGGGMIFGNDQKLYITVGERNFMEKNNPELPFSQDKTDKRGKVYRINPDGSIPQDNPDFGPKAVPGLFALGIRASQGMAIDPYRKNIWFSEHGTIQGDEINILQAGENYGWPHRTSGKYRTPDYKPKPLTNVTFTDPVYTWKHTVAPTGLTFYTGNELTGWYGNLIVPGLSKGSLWRMVVDKDKIIKAEELFIDHRVRLRKATMSPDGQLYVLTDEENGRLLRISSK